MIEPRPISFGSDWPELDLNGVPVIESVLQAFIGRCQECGRAAEEQHEGSVLVNLLELDGTLYGDTFCLGCLREADLEETTFVLPPLPDQFLGEGGD